MHTSPSDDTDRPSTEDLFPCCGRAGLALLLLELFRAVQTRARLAGLLKMFARSSG